LCYSTNAKFDVQGSDTNILNFYENTVILSKIHLTKKAEFQLSVMLSGNDFEVKHSALISGGELVRDIGPKEPRQAIVRAIVLSAVGIVISVVILVISLLTSR
jgi:hypothetical protein